MPAVRISPFAFSDGIQLSLADFDDPVSGRPVAPVRRGALGGDGEPIVYDVSAEPPWRKLTIGLTAKVLETEVRRVLPPGLDAKHDVSLVVSIACPSTKFRHGATLGAKSAGSWTGHLTLSREDLRGVVTIRPMLVLTPRSSKPLVEAGYARRGGSVIGRGDTLQLMVDPSALSPTQAL